MVSGDSYFNNKGQRDWIPEKLKLTLTKNNHHCKHSLFERNS